MKLYSSLKLVERISFLLDISCQDLRRLAFLIILDISSEEGGKIRSSYFYYEIIKKSNRLYL